MEDADVSWRHTQSMCVGGDERERESLKRTFRSTSADAQYALIVSAHDTKAISRESDEC